VALSGFFSIVIDQQTTGHALVRARVREDLEAFCACTGAPPPFETLERDYRFRTRVSFPRVPQLEGTRR